MSSTLMGIVFLFVSLVGYAAGPEKPKVNGGVLDARSYDLKSDGSIPLDGKWIVYYDELVSPRDPKAGFAYTDFPEIWQNGQGVATYEMTILLGEATENLALELPQMYSAYKLYCNGELLAENGKVGTNRSSNRPQWLPKLVDIPGNPETINLILQVANFNHALGGTKVSLVLGTSNELTAKRKLAELVNFGLFGILVVLGIVFLSVYAFFKKEKGVLYFALMCLVWSLRSVFSELYLAIQWLPNLDWELAVKIEYLTLLLEASLAVLFISRLYPFDTHSIINRILTYPIYLFIFFVMATPAALYTKFLNIYLGAAGLVILYVIVVTVRAIIYERYGARFGVLGILAGVGAFSYNMASYLGFFEFNPLLYHTFYVVTFVAVSLALSYQLSPNASKMNTSDEMRFDDFIKY